MLTADKDKGFLGEMLLLNWCLLCPIAAGLFERLAMGHPAKAINIPPPPPPSRYAPFEGPGCHWSLQGLP